MNAEYECDSRLLPDALKCVRELLPMPDCDRPAIGVILGSGLGSAADRLLVAGGRSIAYPAIPGMPLPHVVGHPGRLVLGQISGISVAMLQGRVHWYEGNSIEAVEFGTRLLHALGARTLIVTNAAGGIRADFRPGHLMLVTGHLRPLTRCCVTRHPSGGFASGWSAIENAGCSGLTSLHDQLWNEELRQQVRRIRTSLQIHEGVYGMMSGPNYETPAEIRAMRRLGADAVGMSTVPEALAAAMLGMRVLGVSCITNVAAGLSETTLNHADVTATAAAIEVPFADWLWNVINVIGSQDLPRINVSPAGSPIPPAVPD